MSGQSWGNWNSQPPSQSDPAHSQPQNAGYYNYQGQQQQQQQHAPHDYQLQRGQQQYAQQHQQARAQQQSHYQNHPAWYGLPQHHPQQQYRQHLQMQQMQQQQHQHQHHHQQHAHQFMFNPDANVFVPRVVHGYGQQHQQQQPAQCYGQQQQQQIHGSVQQYPQAYGAAPSSGYNMYQEDARVQGIDAFAQFGQQSQQYMPSQELFAEMQGVASPLLNEILVGCEQLIAEGEEDSATWTSAIRQRFADAKMDDEAKRTGVKLIVEMAFSMEPNQFRGTDPQYTFSNLLKALSVELKDFLRNVILPVLGATNEARKSLDNDSRVYLAVFFAELFVKLTLDNGSRFEKLGEALANQIDEILKFEQKDEYMKCLLRAFKVAGAELDASKELRPRVDQILTMMGGFARGSPLLGESVKAQILSLIECRQRGWDRTVTTGTSSGETTSAGARGAEGNESFDESLDNELTEEERLFLETHLEQAEQRADGGDELDDQEVMNEFGKFVKEELLKQEEAKTADMLSNLSVQESQQSQHDEEDQPSRQ